VKEISKFLNTVPLEDEEKKIQLFSFLRIRDRGSKSHISERGLSPVSGITEKQQKTTLFPWNFLLIFIRDINAIVSQNKYLITF
jgi:hypothetical protein